VPIASEVFSPTVEEIEEARQSMETYRAAEAGGVGAIGRDGKSVDAAQMHAPPRCDSRPQRCARHHWRMNLIREDRVGLVEAGGSSRVFSELRMKFSTSLEGLGIAT
jgi:hypothetical protein